MIQEDAQDVKDVTTSCTDDRTAIDPWRRRRRKEDVCNIFTSMLFLQPPFVARRETANAKEDGDDEEMSLEEDGRRSCQSANQHSFQRDI